MEWLRPLSESNTGCQIAHPRTLVISHFCSFSATGNHSLFAAITQLRLVTVHCHWFINHIFIYGAVRPRPRIWATLFFNESHEWRVNQVFWVSSVGWLQLCLLHKICRKGKQNHTIHNGVASTTLRIKHRLPNSSPTYTSDFSFLHL